MVTVQDRLQSEGAQETMVRRQFFCLLIFACFLVSPVHAEDPQKVYDEGLDHLFNLDFGPAEAAFGSLTREHPENPDYWNELASTYWLKILYNQQKLNFDTFSSKDSFGTKDSKDAVSEAEEKQLRDAVDKAFSTADAMLKKDPKNLQALYAKGNGYGTLASFEATIKRSYLSAARKAKTARNLHKEILKVDPNFHDARASVGIYNYAVGSLSWGARMIVSIVGLGGDGKEVGIRDLELAAAKGERASTEAKMLLIVVYGREREFEKAQKLVDELHAKYPRNFMLEMSKASFYGKMKRWDLASQTYKQIAEKVRARKDGYERMRIEKVLYELGNSEFQGEKFEDASKIYALVAAGEHATPYEKGSAHLWMGRMADTRKDRTSALKHYNNVLKLDVHPDLKSDAERLIKRPFGKP